MKDIYVNRNVKLPAKGRKTADPSRKALEDALIRAQNEWAKTEGERKISVWDNDDLTKREVFLFINNLIWGECGDQVHKDLDKYGVSGGENIILVPGDYAWDCSGDTGIQCLTVDGKPFYYFGFLSGSDYGYAAYGIIYFDGKKLRGYVPSKGNVYNRNTKDPIGEDEWEDNEFLKKEVGIEINDIDQGSEIIAPHMPSIWEDIQARIEIVDPSAPSPTPKSAKSKPSGSVKKPAASSSSRIKLRNNKMEITSCITSQDMLLHELLRESDVYGIPFFKGTQSQLVEFLNDPSNEDKISTFIGKYVNKHLFYIWGNVKDSAVRFRFCGFESVNVKGKDFPFLGFIAEDKHGAMAYGILYATGVYYAVYNSHLRRSEETNIINCYIPVNGNGILNGPVNTTEKWYMDKGLLKHVYIEDELDFNMMFKEIALTTNLISKEKAEHMRKRMYGESDDAD